MTVIAYRAGTMASDKQTQLGNHSHAVTKIYKTAGGWLLGFTGDLVYGLEMVDWFMAGHNPLHLPAFQRTDDYVPMMAISPEGVIHLFEKSHKPLVVESEFYAIGTGRDFALATMYLGHGASEAVVVASALSPSCGHGVDILRLNSLEEKLAAMPVSA